MIFHGYENGHYNMGRQTLLAPVEWTNDGWFKVPDDLKIDEPFKKPSKPFFDDKFSSMTILLATP